LFEVVEPGIVSDDGADFVAGGPGAQAVVDTSGGNNDELIGGEVEFGGQTGADFRIGAKEQTTAGVLGLFGVVRSNGAHGVPLFGGSYQGDGMIGGKRDIEEAGTPEIVSCGIATTGFEARERSSP
jgi:hypothetical protein